MWKLSNLLGILSMLELLSQTRHNFESVENGMDLNLEYLNSLGGLEPIGDRESDELALPEYSEQELEERREKGLGIHDLLHNVLQDSESSDLFKKARVIDLEISMFHWIRIEQLEYDAQEVVIPLFRKANTLFYKLKDLGATVGINQEVRDTVVELVSQAKENIQVIQKLWAKHIEPVRAKWIRSLDQLQKDLKEVEEEYEEETLGLTELFWDFDEYKKHDTYEVILRSKSALEKHMTKEKKVHRMLNIFMKEERNLVKLGIKLWVGAQEDHDINEEQTESPEPEIASSEKQNQRLRKIITLMNVNRAGIKNETDSKPPQKVRKRPFDRDEL